MRFHLSEPSGLNANNFPSLVPVYIVPSKLTAGVDLEEIASTFQGRITFWGEIDRQQVLPFGTTQEVKATVRRFKRSFHDAQGGVIFQLAWSLADPLENIVSAFDEWDGV